MNNNGKPKITAIERFDHSAIAVGRNFRTHEFKSLEALKKYAECRGYEINITHAHPAGVAIRERHAQEEIIPVLRSVCAGMKS